MHDAEQDTGGDVAAAHGSGYGSGSGTGDGDGFGYGSGHGRGFGCGSGSGYGYGSGVGDGDGSGDGDGFGFGSGSGSGSGSGYGYGHGSGYGKPIGTVAGYAVRALPPWPVMAVGCQAHTISHWRERWQDIAESEGVDVGGADVETLLVKAEALLGEERGGGEQ